MTVSSEPTIAIMSAISESRRHVAVASSATNDGVPEKTGSFTNTDRMVQLGRQALEPPGDARQDLWIIQQIARGMGLDWHYAGPHEVFDEMRQAMSSIAGITWQRLEAESSVTYPCLAEGDPGDPVVFVDDFPMPDGRGVLVPADIIPAAERPDADYPMVLITGRQLEHWHTGSMTRRAQVLDAIEPEPVVSIHPLDLEALGAKPGDMRHGRVAPRQGLALCARRRRHAARRRLHSVLLLRSGSQHADEPGARSVRQDSRIQVLRDPRAPGRRTRRALDVRRRANPGESRGADRRRTVAGKGRGRVMTGPAFHFEDSARGRFCAGHAAVRP